MRDKGDTRPTYAQITRLARPWSVLRTEHLLEAGLDRKGISRRVHSRRLYRVHQGVYSIIPPEHLRPEGRWLAAVYACGRGAALSHTCAAALWDMRSVPAGSIHVTVPTTAGIRQRSGIVVHRSSTLLPSQITIEDSIPVTTPARTLADLRRTLPRSQYLAALKRAEKRGLDTGALPERMEDPDRNELERRILALCHRHGIPLPLTQQIIGPYTVDFLWPSHNLIVETDGWSDHGTRSAFEADRERDAWLVARGFRVVRFTWWQLKREGPKVAATLKRILSADVG